MSRPEHLNQVGPGFRARYPSPEALSEILERDLTYPERDDLVADRVMARLGPDVVIGGARAANFPAEVMAQRINGDLDVGLVAKAERLLAMPPAERRAAMDVFVRGRLSADLGDYISLDVDRTGQDDESAFYVITGRLLGKRLGKMQLDVDCDPHLTGPTSNDMQPFCGVDVFGLGPGVRSYQNPADVLAGKLRGIRASVDNGIKVRYAKHVSDMRLMLKHQTFDPRLAAASIVELSRRSGLSIDQLFPLARMMDAAMTYRGRRKRHSPGEDLPMDIMGRDLIELSNGLAPIIEEARSGNAHPKLTRLDIAALLKNEWLPPGLDRQPAPTKSHGFTSVDSSLSSNKFPKSNLLPDSVIRQLGTPPHGAGTPPSRTSSTSRGSSRSK